MQTVYYFTQQNQIFMSENKHIFKKLSIDISFLICYNIFDDREKCNKNRH